MLISIDVPAKQHRQDQNFYLFTFCQFNFRLIQIITCCPFKDCLKTFQWICNMLFTGAETTSIDWLIDWLISWLTENSPITLIINSLFVFVLFTNVLTLFFFFQLFQWHTPDSTWHRLEIKTKKTVQIILTSAVCVDFWSDCCRLNAAQMSPCFASSCSVCKVDRTGLNTEEPVKQ